MPAPQHKHFLNTPFADEPYRPETTLSVSGCIFFTKMDDLVNGPKEIFVETLDAAGQPLNPRQFLRMTKNQVFYRNNAALLHPATTPAMFYAFPVIPKAPGVYQIRSTVVLRSDEKSSDTHTVVVSDGSSAPPRAPDQPGPFELVFIQPAAGAELANDLTIRCTLRLKSMDFTTYLYGLLIESATQVVVATNFNKPLEHGPGHVIGRIDLKPPLLEGAFEIVAYILKMDRGKILESATRKIRLAGVVPPLAAGVKAAGIKKRAAKGGAAIADAQPALAAASFRPDIPETLVNINHASKKMLTALPGIGPDIAANIVQMRKKGSFASVDDLTEVSGIGPAKLKKIKPLITV